MADRLFVSRVEMKDGGVSLGLAVGTPATIAGVEKRRDLPGGLTEHEATLTAGEDRFTLRVLADADGAIVAVVASPCDIPDDWHEQLTLS